MIKQIAWRNIWRNRVRSIVVIASVVVGIWAAAFIVAFSKGMTHSYINTAIQKGISHIQIHASDYLNEPDLSKNMNDGAQMVKRIKQIPRVKAVTSRILINAMAATATTATGVEIRGIDTLNENQVTGIKENIIKGNYLNGSSHHVLISASLAKKLKTKLRHKIVFTFQGLNGELTSASYRVTGIYKTYNSNFDETNVFIRQSDLSQLLQMDGKVSEIAVLLKNNEDVSSVQRKLKNIFPQYEVKNWKQISPILGITVDSTGQFLYMFIFIIVLALIFGIINTMLMAVLERSYEIGMLKAIGMNRKRIFGMITIETFYLSLIGTPIGLVLAWFTVLITGKYGINLSIIGKGLSSYGMQSVIYPQLDWRTYVGVAAFILVATILASFYPARKALKTNPIEAMRTI